MKKLFTIMCAGLLPALAFGQAKTVPYASALYQDTDWTVVDVNEDGKTWADDSSSSNYTGSGYTSGKKYSYHSTNQGNDWCISPAITLEAGKEYKVKFWEKTGSGKESVDLRLASEGTVDALTDGQVLINLAKQSFTSSTKQTAVFTVDTTGDYYFGLYCYTDKNLYWIYVTGFEIAENVFAPAAVSNLTCTPGEDRALTATLTWALPATDNDGAALPENATFDEVTVSRDGVPVASLDGTAVTWTDTEATGLTSGKHTYEVCVVVNGAKSSPSKIESKYIGPVEAQTLPYDARINTMTQEDFDLLWIPVKGRDSGSTADWKFYVSSYYGNSIQYCGGSSKRQDDWVISPQMKFEEPGVYQLYVSLKYNTSTKTNFDILFGQGATIGGYEQVVKNLTSIPSTDTDYYVYVNVETPGEYGFAFHAKDVTGSYYTYEMRQFKVEKWKITPAQVADLTATVNDDATVSLAWTNPSATNTGSELTALAKVELYCDDELVETFTEVAPAAAMTYDHTPASAGVHTYYVLAHSSEGPADGELVKVKTGWVGDETQTLPYSTTFAATDASAPIWSGFDANGDDLTWVVGTSAKLAKPVDYVNHNDYLLSPYFNLEAGHYNVKFSIKGAAKNARLGVGTVSDKKAVAATYSQDATITLPGQSWASDYVVQLNVTDAGRYAIALRYNEAAGPDDYATEVMKFEISYLPVLPGIATEVAVVPSPDFELKATVIWVNPSTSNIEGEMPELVKAEISRNGEVIGEVTEGLVAGEASVFVDETVPQAGEYTYSVKVYGTEGASTDKPAEVVSPWIGAGLDIPWGCSDGFRDAGWAIFNVNGDSNTWGAITWEANNNSIYITSNNTTPDDWAITPRLNFQAGHLYKIAIISGYSSGYSSVSWDIHHGTAVKPEAMTTKLATINTTVPTSAPQTDVVYVKAVDPADPVLAAADEDVEDTTEPESVAVPSGVGTIGIHANQKGAFEVRGFEITDETSSAIEEVEADSKVAVSRGKVFFGAAAETVTVTDMACRMVMKLGGVESLSLDGLAAGVYVVTAEISGKTITVKVLN